MPKVSELRAGQCSLIVPYGDQTVSVVYRPSWLDSDTVGKYQAATNVFDMAAVQVAAALASWDVTDDDGKPVPLNVKAMREARIPLYLLDAIIGAVKEDNTVGKAKPKDS